MKNLLTTNHTNHTKGRRKDFGQKVRVFRVVRGKFLLLYFLVTATLVAQTGISLEAEIQNIERSIARQGVPAQERHAGLVRLATLRQLSGDIEGAARNWLDAARAIPNRIDDDALLNCAYCLAAMGEWERSKTALEPLLSKSARARFLNTSITAITTNNAGVLAVLADDPAYNSMKSEIYFLLWRLSKGTAAERWRQMLVSEFPQSPEARLASGGSLDAEQTIALRQSPFWLLMAMNNEQLTVNSEERKEKREERGDISEQVAGSPLIVSAGTESNRRLQTGIYSREANAQAQAQRLRQAGLTPTIEERQIGENKMWAVTVPQEQEQALKSASIEYFPLR